MLKAQAYLDTRHEAKDNDNGRTTASMRGFSMYGVAYLVEC